MKSIIGTTKKSTMELGGKAANIVFDDAPIDQAVAEGIINGIYSNQGHVRCNCGISFIKQFKNLYMILL